MFTPHVDTAEIGGREQGGHLGTGEGLNPSAPSSMFGIFAERNPSMRPTHFHRFVLILSVLAACSENAGVEDAEDEGSSGTTNGTSSGSTSEAGSTSDTTSPAQASGSEEEATGEQDSEPELDSGSTEDSGGSIVPGDCTVDLASADFGLVPGGWAELGNDRQDPEQQPSATPGGARAKQGHLLVTECGFVLLAENDRQWAAYRADGGKNFQQISDNVVHGTDPHDVQIMDGTVIFVLTTPENQDHLYRMPIEGGEIVQVLAPDDTPQQIFDVHVRDDETAFLLGWDGFNRLYEVPAAELGATTLDLGEPIGMMGRSKSVFEPWTDDVLLVSGSPSQRLDLLCVEGGQTLETCLSAASAGEFHSVDARVGDWLVRFDANADVFIAYDPATNVTLQSPPTLNYHGALASHVHGGEAAIVLNGPDATALYKIGGLSDGELVAEPIDTAGTGLRMTDVWFNDVSMLVLSESSDRSGQISLFGRTLP